MKLYKYVSESRYEEVPAIPIPDNVTNGDFFLMLYKPYCYLPSDNNCSDIGIQLYEGAEIMWFDETWWNAPYKKEVEE